MSTSRTVPAAAVQTPRRLSHDERLVALRDITSFITRTIPVSWMLDGVASRLAALFQAPVVSIYLLEPDGRTLVMRGNVGFSAEAMDAVRMSCGEGLTGMAVESRCPVVVDDGPSRDRHRGMLEPRERRYPVFAAIPLLADQTALGALVLQRPSRRFAPGDVELLVAIASGVATAIRQSGAGDAPMWAGPARRAGGGTRRALLQGRPIVPGRALGPLAAIRRPPRRALSSHVDNPEAAVLHAFDSAQTCVRNLSVRASELDLGADAGFLSVYAQVLDDTRIRARTLECMALGASIPAALAQVAGEAVRAAACISRDVFMEQRARDIEDLCDAIAMMALSDRRAAVSRRAIVIGDIITVYDLLVTARSRPVGVAIATRSDDARTRTILELLGLPAIIDVGGMFRWVSDGDIALLDANQGILLVNPSRSEVVGMCGDRSSAERSIDDDVAA